MRTHNIPSRSRIPKIYAFLPSCPGALINPHWLELPLSRTNFHGPKGVRAIEVLLYYSKVCCEIRKIKIIVIIIMIEKLRVLK